ncbi:hypothetical protein KP509_15G065900 [Ceratopteris richardii]|nr:hypothetical protein KP509_15G065900 [Ceratopteris richardii]
MDPFTKIPGGIYRRMRSIFLKKAAARGMKIVQSHPPFDTCFNSSSIGFSRVGPAAPPMELELTGVGGKDVGWSVFGFNSIVSVSDEKSCWAFLDGGAQTHSTSVLGTFQQQGNFFEFDLQNSTLGFSGHLNFFRTSCSNFAF